MLTSFATSDNTLGGYKLGEADTKTIFGSISAAEHMTIIIHGQPDEANILREK